MTVVPTVPYSVRQNAAIVDDLDKRMVLILFLILLIARKLITFQFIRSDIYSVINHWLTGQGQETGAGAVGRGRSRRQGQDSGRGRPKARGRMQQAEGRGLGDRTQGDHLLSLVKVKNNTGIYENSEMEISRV